MLTSLHTAWKNAVRFTRSQRRQQGRLYCEELEPRVVLSADSVAAALLSADLPANQSPADANALMQEHMGPSPTGIIDVGDLPGGIIDVGDLPCEIIDVGDLPGGIIDVGDLPCEIIDVGDLPGGIIDVGDLPCEIIDVGDLPGGIIDVGDLPCEIVDTGFANIHLLRF